MSQSTSDISKLMHKLVEMPIHLKLRSEAGHHNNRGNPNEKEPQICICGSTSKIYYDGMCIDAELTVADNEGTTIPHEIWANRLVDLEIITSENNHVQAQGRAKWYYMPENNPCKLELGVLITQMPDQERAKWNRLFA